MLTYYELGPIQYPEQISAYFATIFEDTPIRLNFVWQYKFIYGGSCLTFLSLLGVSVMLVCISTKW